MKERGRNSGWKRRRFLLPVLPGPRWTSWGTAPAWHREQNGSSLLPPCPGSQRWGRTVWGEEKTSLGEDAGGEDAARGGLDSYQHFAPVSIFASAGRPAASFLLLEGKVWSRKSPTIFLFFLLGKFSGSSGRSTAIDTSCTRQEPTKNAPSAGWGAPGRR